MKRTMITCLAGTYLLTGVGFAAPVVDISKGDVLADLSYNRLDIDDVNKKFDATEISLTHGLSDKFALSTGVTFTGDETITFHNQPFGSVEANIVDVRLQYKATNEFAPFIGYKKWEIDAEGPPADIELASKSGVQYGVIYNTKVADRTNAFAMASFGNDIKEYKVGLAYDVNKNCAAEINYKKISLDTNSRDIDAKGLGFGVTYKF